MSEQPNTGLPKIASIVDILVQKERITQSEAQKFVAQAEQTGIPIASVLIESRIVTANEILKYVAEAMNIGFVELGDYPIDKTYSQYISQEMARKHHIVPIHSTSTTLTVAMPLHLTRDLTLRDQIRIATGFTSVEVIAAPEGDILTAINEMYRVDAELNQIAAEASAEASEDNAANVSKINDDVILSDESKVEKFVRLAIAQAITDRASDIIFECHATELLVRFRIDGVFHDFTRAHKSMSNEIISRIKIMADMDISKRNRPLDGRLHTYHEGVKVDLRVNSFPTQDGENVTMRILDNTQANLNLTELGFSERNLERFNKAILKPYGMILVTGPTGSGKSVTLYSGLSTIANASVNTLTIEDPIEYRVPFVTQSQLNEAVGWSYPEAIRAFMRAAPNNILVGEIRDLPTATVAMQAGMTGHLVLSTLHTNSSSEVPARLLDLGIEQHIISSTLTAMVAQRLVRKLCNKCKIPYTPNPDELLAVGFPWKEGNPLPTGMFRPNPEGCKDCGRIGFRGRTAAYEVLLVDDTIRRLIAERAESFRIEEAAIAAGMTKMIDDGWDKVARGITTIPEVLKSIV